jgi:hypothetical protein
VRRGGYHHPVASGFVGDLRLSDVVLAEGHDDRTTPRKEVKDTMTDPNKDKVKTLGIRLPDELHTQFVLVASLDGLSLTDAIRRAVELYVETKRSEGDFAERATAALEEIEREAATRRSAIEGLFGQGAAQAAESDASDEGGSSSPRGRQRKS